MTNTYTYVHNKNPHTIAGSGRHLTFEVTTNQNKMATNLLSPDEIFKPVFGYEGYYEISNYGRLKGLERVVPKKNGRNSTIKERIIIPDLNSKGYVRNKMAVNSRITRFLVHRMVAIFFVPNPFPESFDQVNHIDGNKQNNYYKNLEWSNNSLNQIHRHKVLGQPGGMLGHKVHDKYKTPINELTLDGQLVKRWESITDLRKAGYYSWNIRQVIEGTKKQYKGSLWELATKIQS